MNNKRLITLIKRYQKEVTSGDMHHLDDLIAAMVIADLTKVDDSYLIKYGINNISLATLLGIKKGKTYTVPNKYEIYDNKKKYERNSKLNYTSYTSQEEVAANTWIDMIMKTGMINESETIIPSEYILNKFIKDINLRDILPLSYMPRKSKVNKELGITPVSRATKKVLELRQNKNSR